jgi:hypothetical protein
MNKILGFLIVCIASNVYAQNNDVASRNDLLEIVSVDRMPLQIPQTEIENLKNGLTTKATDGFSAVERSPGTVKNFFLHLNAAKTSLVNKQQNNFRAPTKAMNSPEVSENFSPEIYKDLSALKLTFKPAIFTRGELLVASSAGTNIKNAWSGMDRFFHVNGAGVVRLTEYDLGPTNGKFFMAKEAVNTYIKGKPAISKIFTDETGQSVEEIVWVSGSIFHMLTFGPDVIEGRTGTKQKNVPYISAVSLAQELQQ